MAEVDINVSCIYKVLNTVTNKFYIGSCVIFRKRRNLHLLQLRKNIHHSRYLQNAYNKYGEESFKFEIIEICEKHNLQIREQFYLDNLKPDYNVSLRTDSRLGIKSKPEHIAKIVAKNTGKKRTPEQKYKLRKLRLGKTLTEEQKQARRDYKHTKEAKTKISLALIKRHGNPVNLVLTSPPIMIGS